METGAELFVCHARRSRDIRSSANELVTTTPDFDPPPAAERVLARFAAVAAAPCFPSQSFACRARRRHSQNYFHY
jgi:hypothetical protein